MELRTEHRLSGAELREEILERHGGLENLRKKAGAGDAEASDDLLQLTLLEKEPHRLRHEYTITTVFRLRDEEILLTRPRLRMMSVVSKAAKARKPLGVTELAKRLRRDKKNVSQEVGKLEKLGFLRTKREGQRKLVLPHGNEIHVIFDR